MSINCLTICLALGFIVLLLCLDVVNCDVAISNSSVCSPEAVQNCGKTAFSESDLMQFIFTNYSRAARPRWNAKDSVTVTLSLRLSSVYDLIERENVVILDASINVAWTDDYLVWNSTFPYCCFTGYLIVPANSTWLPDIALISAPNNGLYSLMNMPGFAVYILSDGSLSYVPAGLISSKCEIDVTYFPLDRQICMIHFESWNYETTEQTFALDPNHPFVQLPAWTANRQWHLEANFSDVTKVRYFGERRYSHAIFTLVLRRKALFYYINIIVPSIIISVVELATFSLPIGEVIKVHISFTCLLAYSVFQGMVIADLPRSGDSVPLLTLYIELQMAYIGIIALMGEAVVFVIIHKAELKTESPPSRVLSTCKMIARFLWVDCSIADGPQKRNIHNNQAPSGGNAKQVDGYHWQSNSFSLMKFFKPVEIGRNLAENVKMTTGFWEGTLLEHKNNSSSAGEICSTLDEEESDNNLDKEWMMIAQVVDRINMVLYSAAITLTPIIIFSVIPSIYIVNQFYSG